MRKDIKKELRLHAQEQIDSVIQEALAGVGVGIYFNSKENAALTINRKIKCGSPYVHRGNSTIH